jgi:transcriptional regulator with XRE-family HTH domain
MRLIDDVLTFVKLLRIRAYIVGMRKKMQTQQKEQPKAKLFPARLAALRKKKGMTQQALAEAINIHVTQLSRYESGASQPTLDVIRKIAIALSVSADELIFDESERGPADDLRLQFEAVSKFPAEEKKVIKAVLEGLILKHEAKRWSSAA